VRARLAWLGHAASATLQPTLATSGARPGRYRASTLLAVGYCSAVFGAREAEASCSSSWISDSARGSASRGAAGSGLRTGPYRLPLLVGRWQMGSREGYTLRVRWHADESPVHRACTHACVSLRSGLSVNAVAPFRLPAGCRRHGRS